MNGLRRIVLKLRGRAWPKDQSVRLWVPESGPESRCRRISTIFRAVGPGPRINRLHFGGYPDLCPGFL